MKDSDTDWRVRVVQAQGQEAVFVVVDHGKIAGPTRVVLPDDSLIEDPWMAMPNGVLRRWGHPQVDGAPCRLAKVSENVGVGRHGADAWSQRRAVWRQGYKLYASAIQLAIAMTR